MLKAILNNIGSKIKEIVIAMGVSEINIDDIIFEVPKDSNFGDYSTNIAMRLAKQLRKKPLLIAQDIINRLNLDELHLTKCEVAGAGFINFFFDEDYLSQIVFSINKLGQDYGKGEKVNKNINLEFVSANPTGYLHIGHGRGAAYGDSLAKILRKAGYQVTTEHYVNDAGNQINNLAKSIYERYKQLFGLEYHLEDGYYHGPEIITIAEEIKNQYGDKYLHEDWYAFFRSYGVNYLLNGLKVDLKAFNVKFDIWFSEQSLYDSGEVEKSLRYLIDNNYTYEKDGAVWLKTTDFNDEKDRVLVKSDGNYTYLTPDIAYHINKFNRGFDILINVLGADHHGHIDPLKTALAIIGKDPNSIEVEILQMVHVIKDGEEIKMSKRSGKAITLRDLIDEVGTDALRFMYTSKALSTPMDLDLDLLLKQSNDNPVYYAQYAYARICSLFRTLESNGMKFSEVNQFTKLDTKKTKNLVMNLLQYPHIIEEAASKRIPHRITQYVSSLAASLHSYYNDEKIISDDSIETNEKLTVLKAVQTVLKDGLNLIGVSVKEKM